MLDSTTGGAIVLAYVVHAVKSAEQLVLDQVTWWRDSLCSYDWANLPIAELVPRFEKSGERKELLTFVHIL